MRWSATTDATAPVQRSSMQLQSSVATTLASLKRASSVVVIGSRSVVEES